MRPKRAATALVLALALALLAGALGAGCGGGDGEDGYDRLVADLGDAALAKANYAAVKHMQGLDETQRASIVAFCNVTRQILLNREAYKLVNPRYYFSRIQSEAEQSLPFVSTDGVTEALDRLDEEYDFASFDADTAQLYSQACFR